MPDEAFRLFLAQLAFPIASIVADARYGGIVCLAGTLRATIARSFSLRGCWSDAKKVALARNELDQAFHTHAPVTLVIEPQFNRDRDPVARRIAEMATRAAMDRGVRVRKLSLIEASARIVTDSEQTFQNAATALLRRYPQLARSLAPDGHAQVNDSDCWRLHRSLSAAFCLAHAEASDVLVAAARASRVRPPTNSI